MRITTRQLRKCLESHMDAACAKYVVQVVSRLCDSKQEYREGRRGNEPTRLQNTYCINEAEATLIEASKSKHTRSKMHERIESIKECFKTVRGDR